MTRPLSTSTKIQPGWARPGQAAGLGFGFGFGPPMMTWGRQADAVRKEGWLS